MTDRFTRLEREVMAALAHDVRHVAPDLAGQFEESLPGTRRNTGAGLFTETIVSSRRPLAEESETGRFGTVHAMVGDLPDPIAFQVELRNGRLLALHGDAYGQDTRAIDFARVPFDQVFTLNDQGESIAFEPAALMRPSPLLDLQHHNDHEAGDPGPTPPPLVNPGALQRLQDARPAALVRDPPPADPLPAEDRKAVTSLMTGIWMAAGVVALVAVLFLRVSLVFILVAAFWLAALLRKPSAKVALARVAKALGRFEVRSSGL